MPKTSPFSPGLFRFLHELASNNDRDWFEANKDRYEECVREPAREFIRQMMDPLATISESFVADDRKAGGSMMRIHRDVRFGKDKRPYKTNVGIQFRHDAGKDVHAPGFYVHLEPDQCFLGVGMWHPEAVALRSIRDAIVADPAAYKKARAGKAFARDFAFEGDSLVRAPKGYDPDHPLIDELRRKDHIAVCRLADVEFLAGSVVSAVSRRLKTSAPFMRWLCGAVGVGFQ